MRRPGRWHDLSADTGAFGGDALRRVSFGVPLPLLLASCASGSGLPSATERAIESYYAAHAREAGGRCPAPFIDGFTRADVVEDGPQRQVVDVRYLYGDRIKNGSDGDGAQCVGFNGRRFILAKTAAGVEVVEMTGPQRG
jgi:hypothetical protein